MLDTIERPRASERPPGTSFVDVLRWPRDAGQRSSGRRLGRACLWLLAPGELPPACDPTEGWARLPLPADEVDARVVELADRVFHGRSVDRGVVRVTDGLLRYGGRLTVIPATEAVLLDRLGATPDELVPRAELDGLANAGGGRCTLDSRIWRLRRRISSHGLVIETVRGRGFVLTTRSRGDRPADHRPTTPGSTSWPSS